MSMNEFQKASWYAYTTSETAAGESYPSAGGYVMTPFGVGFAPPKNCADPATDPDYGAANSPPSSTAITKAYSHANAPMAEHGSSIGAWLCFFFLCGAIALCILLKVLLIFLCAVLLI